MRKRSTSSSNEMLGHLSLSHLIHLDYRESLELKSQVVGLFVTKGRAFVVPTKRTKACYILSRN